MKILAGLVAATAALALAATASAKEIKQITACGANDCRTSTDPGLIGSSADGGGPAGAPAKVAVYYTIEFTAEGDGHSETWMIRYFPSQSLGRADNGVDPVSWFTVPPSQAAVFRQLTDGIRPFGPDGGAPPAASPSDDGFPWVVLLFSLGLAAVLGTAALLNARRRAPAPAPGS